MSLTPGMVRILANHGPAGFVGAQVCADRPTGIGMTLLRHPPADIPLIAGRLFALCGRSQSIAARLALSAAGLLPAPEDLRELMRQLAAERLAEHLRSLLISWNRLVPPRPEEAGAARSILAMVDQPGMAGRIEASLGELGIVAGADILQPRPGTWSERLLASASAETSFAAITPDALSVADDAAVIAALIEGGEAFAARPALPGRIAETGAPARLALRGIALPAEGMASRMAARLIEIGEACAQLQQPVAEAGGWFHAAPLENGGYAAVESPRGRLYHMVWRDASGTPARYLTLAPTEWNFHPQGPFARALAGGKLSPTAQINDTIATLAALYDPCVACDIRIEETLHA